MPNPAQNVIKKCGGAKAVAEMLRVHVSRVNRWTYPKDRGGCDGVIPAKQQQKLLEIATERGLPIEPADFFDLSPDLPRRRGSKPRPRRRAERK